MQRLLLSMLLTVSFIGLGNAKEETGPAAEKVKQEILKLDLEKVESLRQNGSAAADWFDQNVDEDSVTTSFDGRTETKAEHEPKLRSSKVAIIAMKQFDHRVRVFGNGKMAVVTYKQIGQLEGQAHPIEGVATEVWVKEDAGWRRVVHSSHELVKKE